MLAVKLFILEAAAYKAHKELDLTYNTTHKIYTKLRLGGKRKGSRGRGAKSKIPVFGILERNGKVKVEIVKDISAETLLIETIKKVKKWHRRILELYKGEVIKISWCK